MFTIIVPPLRPPRLTPEETEPYAFTLGEQIGRGAFSVVYALRAPSGALAAKVMVKRDLPPDHVEQLLSELRVLRTLHHPNIIRLHATHEDDETLSIIMERASCDLLECLQKNGLFSEVRARRLMRQLLCALEFCHANGIIHRDIKPENLLLFGDSHAADVVLKVADFGTVRILDDNFGRASAAGSPAAAAAAAATQSGLIEAMRAMVTSTSRLGTSYYMAPEVCWRRPYGEVVDVWSAGVVLHVLLSGEAPWAEGRTPHPKEGGGAAPAYAAPVWGAASAEVRELLQGMLAVDAAARLSAAAALAASWFSTRLADGAADSMRAWFGAALPSGAPGGKASPADSPQSINDPLGGGGASEVQSPVESPRLLPSLLSPQTVSRQCLNPLACCSARKTGGTNKPKRHSYQPY